MLKTTIVKMDEQDVKEALEDFLAKKNLKVIKITPNQNMWKQLILSLDVLVEETTL